MPTVFLSYSRSDLARIEQLQAQLKSHPDISVWHDQEKIYGGQKWPKRLGEEIANRDVFLLAWSKHSAASHFVEFEWCTAIALKKTIVPCLLDDTSLAPSLKTFHGYRLGDVAGLIKSLRTAPPADEQRRKPVIRKLDEITATEETAVLAQAKAVFAQ
jgi:TIR domain